MSAQDESVIDYRRLADWSWAFCERGVVSAIMAAEDVANRCPNCERRVRELEAQVERLTATVERLTQALEAPQRAGKRQAAPFSKGSPAAAPKTPGRKSGDEHGVHRHRAAPAQIDETHEVPLPSCCPDCGGRKLVETAVVVQYQTDIPRRPIVRQFDIHVGQCGNCGQRVHMRHDSAQTRAESRQLPLRARSSTGWAAGGSVTTAGSQPIAVLERPPRS